jgi:hypothetical protein
MVSEKLICFCVNYKSIGVKSIGLMPIFVCCLFSGIQSVGVHFLYATEGKVQVPMRWIFFLQFT